MPLGARGQAMGITETEADEGHGMSPAAMRLVDLRGGRQEQR